MILIANRDEYYQRPTKELHFWEENPTILGGRDLTGNGSWLAFNATGKFAAVTNFREAPAQKGRISRGLLVSGFLQQTISARAFLLALEKEVLNYAGFNLLLGDAKGIYYFSSHGGAPKMLSPGLYGLSNHLLDTPWPKLKRAKNGLSTLLEQPASDIAPEQLAAIMQDTHRPDDADLPNTGVSLDKERLYASCFIRSDDYGTRNTSVIRVSALGLLEWHEQLYGTDGIKGSTISHTMQWLPREKEALTMRA